MSSDDIAIRVSGLGKCYQLYDSPRDRLRQFVLPRLRRALRQPQKHYFHKFWALRDISFELEKGETLGIIGKNGAGKSTLLQILCGTLTPTGGMVETNGRVAALLELGAGFNPEFTGRENVYLNASVLGLSTAEIDVRFDEIVTFADIGLFIDQPVKTYSSGMFVRLAFSIATSVEPDILVIDEALSVGDGEFSRKSFDRIMALKKRGTTILFCSHALYQVEVFCDRVLWLDHGCRVMLAPPQEVVRRYSTSLLGENETTASEETVASEAEPPPPADAAARIAQKCQGHFTDIKVSMDGIAGRKLKGRYGENDLSIRLEFICDPDLPAPTIGVVLKYGSLLAVTCVSSHTDRILINLDSRGHGIAEITFPRLALRKGKYFVNVHLCCENALHFYDTSISVAEIEMEDPYPEPGLVTLPHRWRCIEPALGKAILAERTDPTLVKVHGSYLMEIDGLDSLGLAHNNGVFEAEETALCRLLLKKGDRVLDIGANIGYFTLLFGGLVSPTGSVLAIEPDAKNYDLLQNNIARNQMAGLVSIRQAALGSQAGSARLYHSDSNNGMHRLYASVCCTDNSAEVHVIVGDSLKLAPLDFIKIDIEGYEPAALQGLSSTLAHSPNLKILSEFSPLSIWEAGFSPIGFLHEMQKYRFHLFCNEPDGWCETPFEVFLAELEKIPEPAVVRLIREFEQEKDIQMILQRASDFLVQHGYSRPMVENILFVAPGAMEEVSLLLMGASNLRKLN